MGLLCITDARGHKIYWEWTTHVFQN